MWTSSEASIGTSSSCESYSKGLFVFTGWNMCLLSNLLLIDTMITKSALNSIVESILFFITSNSRSQVEIRKDHIRLKWFLHEIQSSVVTPLALAVSCL